MPNVVEVDTRLSVKYASITIVETEEGGTMILRNVGLDPQDCTVTHPKIPQSEKLLPLKLEIQYEEGVPVVLFLSSHYCLYAV
jgi:hypothetical protein